MTVLLRLRAWVASTLWYYRQLWRRFPVDPEYATLTRLPRPVGAAETPATPPQTPVPDAAGQWGGHEAAAVRGALVRLHDGAAGPDPREGSRV